MEQTCDAAVMIESRTTDSIIYIVPATGERWRIDGVCNQCGECWIGAVGERPTFDCPVRPEIRDDFPNCTLSGAYLVPADVP